MRWDALCLIAPTRIRSNRCNGFSDTPLESKSCFAAYPCANSVDFGMDAARNSDERLVALLDAVGQRDAPALKALYDLTAPRLYGLALRLVRQRELAQDVLQEAFLTVWRAAGDYRDALSPPLAWLGLIVRSRALDALRRRKAAREDVSESLDERGHDDGPTPLDHLSSEAPGPMERVQASQAARALHGCLSGLEPRQREVLSLAYLRELSHGELSEQLKLPLGTVKTWIRRGLEQLRVCMARFA